MTKVWGEFVMAELGKASGGRLRRFDVALAAPQKNARNRGLGAATRARRVRASRVLVGRVCDITNEVVMQCSGTFGTDNPVLFAEVERALAPYDGIAPRVLFHQMRALLVFALTTHPDAALMLRQTAAHSKGRGAAAWDAIMSGPGSERVPRQGMGASREGHGWTMADILGVGAAMDDEQAELVRQGIALVRRLSGAARRDWLNLLRYEDLISAGTKGLFDAAHRFRRAGGDRYAAFARYSITGSIMGAMAERASLAERRLLLAWTRAFEYLSADFHPGGAATRARDSARRLAAFSDGLLSVMASPGTKGP
jgi:hypothetical protein